ncbi:hypothetical protein P3S67_013838 [Capsicum chacoense]
MVGREVPRESLFSEEFENLKMSELNLETPIQLSSLKRFEVDGCPKAGVLFDEAEVFTSQLEGMKQIEELVIATLLLPCLLALCRVP